VLVELKKRNFEEGASKRPCNQASLKTVKRMKVMRGQKKQGEW
jgi:hypothetical protein